MKFQLILCICVLILTANLAIGQFRWNESFYQEYNYDSFAKSKLANQEINFRNIDFPLLHAAIFYETNRQRVKNGKKPFQHSLPLEHVARQHSLDMVRRHFFSHESPVRGKKTMSMRLAKAGIKNAYQGENIAIFFGLDYESGKPVFVPSQNGGYFSYSYRGEPLKPNTYLSAAEAVVNNWMSSAGHRENILNENFLYLGVGAAYFEDRNFNKMPSFKVTQNFSSDHGQ